MKGAKETMLTTTALTTLKNCIKDSISYAQYKVNGEYHKAEIRDARILDDGRVAISFIIDHTLPGDIIVTEVQLYDHNSSLWASKAESITRRNVQEGILYRFAFTITES